MAVNTAQIRDLLRPGLYEIAGHYHGVVDVDLDIDCMRDCIVLRARNSALNQQRQWLLHRHEMYEDHRVAIDWYRRVRTELLATWPQPTPEEAGTVRQRRVFRIPGGMRPYYDDLIFPPEAESLARELLLSNLSPDQKKAFEKKKEFVVVGKSGREYRLTPHRWPTKNVTWMEQRKPMVSYCAQPNYGKLPMGDILLAQKIALEVDDLAFCKTACHVAHPNFYHENYRSVLPVAPNFPAQPQRSPGMHMLVWGVSMLLGGQLLVQLAKLF